MNVTDKLTKVMKNILNFKTTNNKEKKTKNIVKWYFFYFGGLLGPLNHVGQV